MARWIDLMLCIFPFEPDLYNRSGLRAVFVGHPMIDRLSASNIETQRDPNLIGLFPGSRSREVKKIFPFLLAVAEQLRREKPELRFEVAAASAELAREMEGMCERSADHVRIKTGEALSLMQRASIGVVASGSATLEAAYFRLPFVLVYKVAWPTYAAARMVVKVDYLGMPNVLANKRIVHEFIQHEAHPRAIAAEVLRLISDASARKEMISEFDSVIAKLGESGASDRAARA